MIAQLHTGFLLFILLGLFLSLVAVIVAILLMVSASLRPDRWHERTREARLVQSTERKEMVASM